MIKYAPMERSPETRSWLSPSLQFLALGGALLLLSALVSGRGLDLRGNRAEVVLTAERVQQLESEWHRHLGRPPTPAERDTLLANAVEDEFFFAEAIDLGLHEQDPRVRARLESLLAFASTGGPHQEADQKQEEGDLDQALRLGLHQRDALVHGWLVALGKEAALSETGASETGARQVETKPEEALGRLRQKFTVRVEEPSKHSREAAPGEAGEAGDAP